MCVIYPTIALQSAQKDMRIDHLHVQFGGAQLLRLSQKKTHKKPPAQSPALHSLVIHVGFNTRIA